MLHARARAALALLLIFVVHIPAAEAAGGLDRCRSLDGCPDQPQEETVLLQLGQSLQGATAPAADESGVTRIHILSMGRVGSCFTLATLEKAGHPTIFEPLNGIIEGIGTLATTPVKSLDCLYSCGECTTGSINAAAFQKRKAFCADQAAGVQEPVLAIKDTRIIDLSSFNQLSAQKLAGTKFVLLLRDPRAVWSSLKPWTTWAIHSMPLMCQLLYTQVATLPALRDTTGADNILVLYFEQWAADLDTFGKRLLGHVQDGGPSAQVQDFLREKQDASHITSWVGKLDSSEVAQIEGNMHCKKYMDAVGYKRDEKTDYSGLKDPATIGPLELLEMDTAAQDPWGSAPAALREQIWQEMQPSSDEVTVED